MKSNYRFLALALSGLLVLPMNLAAQGDDGDKPENMESEFDFGAYVLSDDSYRFGKYTGLTEDGFEPLFNFKVVVSPEWNSEDTRSWRLQGWRLGHDSMRLEFEYDDQGNQELSVDYREIPNFRFSDGMTPFNGASSGDLTLPANWVAPPNSTTADFATLHENLGPVSKEWKRERLDISYSRVVRRDWDFSVDWRHESKDGLRTFGGVIGNSGANPRAVVLPAPINWDTDIMEASFTYAKGIYQYGFSVYASWFDNGQTSATWENPYGRRSGWANGVGFPDGQGLYALEPENQAIQYRVYGGVNISPTSRLSADLSTGTMEQDDPLFGYSINPGLRVDVPLPRARMDAEIETMHANVRYSARPLKKLSLLFNYTLDDRDNKTPRDEWIYIGGDSENQKDPEEARINLPYSFEMQKYNLTATWRASRGVRVKGGIEKTDYSRTYSEVLDSDEDKVFAGVKINRWENASLSFDFASSERDVDEYKGNRTLILSHLPGEIGPDEVVNLPGLRKYNQADREREEYRFRADFFPGPKFNFALAGSWFDDDYNDDDADLFGLKESEVTSWSVDAGFYPKDGISLTAYFTSEAYDSLQAGRTWSPFGGSDNPENNWYADSEDDVETWNVSFTFDDYSKKGAGRGSLKIGTDYTYSNVESDINVTGGANINSKPLPTLVSEMKSWTVFGTYGISDNSSIRLTFEMQELKTSDFALDGVPVDGLENVLLLGESSANYDLSLVTLSWSYKY